MRKMFGWLWKAAAAALLASFLAIWTTGYIVNSYVEALLEEYEIPLEKPPFALSGLWGRLWGVSAVAEDPRDGLAADAEPDRGTAGGRTAADGARSGSGGEGAAPGPAGGERGGRMPDGDGSAAGGEAPDSPGDASGWPPGDEGGSGEASGGEESGFGAGPAAHGAAVGSGGAVVSTEDLLEAKSRLTDDERNRLFAILVGKVPQEEWQRISAFTEGGLTADELMQVQQIVAAYLDRPEYDELMRILGKFR